MKNKTREVIYDDLNKKSKTIKEIYLNCIKDIQGEEALPDLTYIDNLSSSELKEEFMNYFEGSLILNICTELESVGYACEVFRKSEYETDFKVMFIPELKLYAFIIDDKEAPTGEWLTSRSKAIAKAKHKAKEYNAIVKENY